MKIKHCEHCNKVYQPEKKGLMAVLCRRCKEDCEASAFKLQRLIRQLEVQGLVTLALDVEKMAEEAQIPSLFAVLLLKEGYFKLEKYGRDETESRACDKCKQTLLFGQKRYCDACTLDMSNKLRSAISLEPAPSDPNYGMGGHSQGQGGTRHTD